MFFRKVNFLFLAAIGFSIGLTWSGPVKGIEIEKNVATEQNVKSVQEKFIQHAGSQNFDFLLPMPIQDNGRIKPFQTFARESILFLTGKYSFWGISAPNFYFALLGFSEVNQLQIIDVRSPELREKLGLDKKRRLFSLNELDSTSLATLAQSLMSKKEMNGKNLSEEQKVIIETYHQVWNLRQIQLGEHLAQGLNLDFSNQPNSAQLALSDYLTEPGEDSARKLLAAADSVSVPVEVQQGKQHLKLEVLYNNIHPFLLATIWYLFFAGLLFFQKWKLFLNKKSAAILMIPGLIAHTLGFTIRVVITGFAPVTNMYGTMLWVSLGVTIFSVVLLLLYSNFQLTAFLALASAGILLLTESIPLVLQPGMDPIVAVLRSNYWLTLHVLTITISYAAFTIAMLIGNVALIREIFGKSSEEFYKQYSHYAYRMIQLGCFLLTIGIILGGIWADYSWGRFWGWDPKETWALIADLGFLILLHARLIGWLKHFGLLAWSTMAYLLVVMAWYGVNFVLASGLHSYGFSAGGALAIAVFLGVQVGLFSAAMFKRRSLN